MLGFIAGVVPFLIIISLIVSFHEYGHFSVAKLFGTRIERFSVGFVKILLRHRDKSGVEWCLSALPLGGYVKFAGDENIASMMPSREELDAARQAITAREGAEAVKTYFHFKPLWQRFLIILAGPVFNFILAILVFTIIYTVAGDTFSQPRIIRVAPSSPAAAAGFQPNDLIMKIDGHSVDKDADQARMLIVLKANTPTTFVVKRSDHLVNLTATPARAVIDPTGRDTTMTGGRLGVEFDPTLSHRPLNPLQALVMGNSRTWQVLETNLTYIGRIFTGKDNANQIGGVLGMTKAAGDMTVAIAAQQVSVHERLIEWGLNELQLLAVISIGVGFLNLLPVPALDGGHLAFYAIQSVTKKTIPAGIQNAAFRIAIVLVLGLMLFAAWNDLNHFGLSRLVSGWFS